MTLTRAYIRWQLTERMSMLEARFISSEAFTLGNARLNSRTESRSR